MSTLMKSNPRINNHTIHQPTQQLKLLLALGLLLSLSLLLRALHLTLDISQQGLALGHQFLTLFDQGSAFLGISLDGLDTGGNILAQLIFL
jgi:hypothetical protein